MSQTHVDNNIVEQILQEKNNEDTTHNKGLVLERFYSKKGLHPFDEIKWDYRTASITNEKGGIVFEQKNIEVPSFWSQLAVNVVVSKYFHGKPDSPEREKSIKQLISRVANTTTEFGWSDGYFADEESREIFRDELTYLLVNQHLAFNSPVWFNLGIEKPNPQLSACFINSVKDSLDSIMDLAKTEAMLFKFGSGTGTNLSTLRSSVESLSGGGTSSGPLSFMKGFDSFAGVIKSGGKTRRAAKMVILNDNHPDIVDFINSKSKEEKKAWALIDAGYDASFNGEAYSSIAFQNANHSVRVSDKFMNAVVNDGEWQTKFVTTGETSHTYKAKDLMNMIAESTYICGDPGLQFDTISNKWHTCKNSGRINASNPCVTGKTRVLTKGGKWQRIDQLLDRKIDIVVNLNDLKTVEINGSFKTGTKPVYLLKTKCGYELELTADHKVYTENRGFIQACELTKDDFVKLPQNVVGKIQDPDDYKFYQMLGYYIGDGSGTSYPDSGIQLVGSKDNEGQKILESFALYVSENYERKTHKNKENHGKLFERGATYAYTINVNECKAQIAELVDLSLHSHEKIISEQIFNLDLGKQKFILQGLFTADGTVGNYGDKSQYISLDSTSLELLKNTQLMLLGFGLKSKLYLNRRAGKSVALLPDGRGGSKEYNVREMYSLRISRTSRVKFQELIGFMPESAKYEKLAMMNKLVSAYEDKMFDSVGSLEYIGEKEVYDLTEPMTSSFIANGLVIHNCSEYFFLDDTACNLASINLMKYLNEDSSFDLQGYLHTIDTSILAQEIFVGNASYP
ncbi:MAG: intein-containing adenosylcobalamin-dependent ribonucleoside-diphosphate reductase, partial [Candidatus Sericytochromatia bacterium]|nr:intein-containing adenosylcobalamin-dependent ribonucleoside-diphosphate reductase [Candidatus Sericytochromatia bacterium]